MKPQSVGTWGRGGSVAYIYICIMEPNLLKNDILGVYTRLCRWTKVAFLSDDAHALRLRDRCFLIRCHVRR